MANEPKMKIGIGADTGDFDKGAKKVKQEMKDLSKVSSDAFGAIGNAIGVDTGKLTQFSSALQGLGNKLQQTGTAGAKAFGEILTSIGPLAGAIAGIGIGAATIAFKALKDEAEAFKNTVEGANIELATAAYISTYNQILHDYRRGLGEMAAELEADGKKVAGTWWETFKTFFSSGAFVDLIARNGNAGLEAFATQTGAARTGGSQAEALTKQIYDLERKRKENAIEIAKINAQIADKLSIARDTSASIAARQQAIQDVEALIQQKKAISVTLERQLANLYRQRSNLAKDSVEAADATLAQEQRAWEVERQITEQSNGLLRVKNQIATAAKKSADAAKEEADNIARVKAAQANLTSISSGSPLLNQVAEIPVKLKIPEVEKLTFKHLAETELAGIQVEVGFVMDSTELNNIAQQAAEQIKSVMVNTLESLTESIGTLLGDLATGKDGWNDFANSAVQAFGDMAVAIGKIAIEAGTSVIALKAAMGSMSIPGAYLAIAAGMALVALGSAVKAGMANIAAGNYSGGGIATSSSSSSIGGDYESRDVNVNVTGTLQADGDQLVAVINNSNKKSYYTT